MPGEDSVEAVEAIPSARWPFDQWKVASGSPSRALKQALPNADRWKALSREDPTHRPLAVQAATDLGSLAQSDFSDEPQEARRGRLRGLALQGALAAYKELNSFIWDCKPYVCSDKTQYLYAQGLLQEQAADREGASQTYRQVMETTSDSLLVAKCHVGLAMVAESAHDPSKRPVVLSELQQALNILFCSPGPGEKERPKFCMPDESLQENILDHVQSVYPQKAAEIEKWLKGREERAAAEAAEEQLWSPLQQAGDDVATKSFSADLARSLEPKMTPPKQAQTEKAIKRLLTHRDMVVRSQFCPAKKAFVARLGAEAFTKKAATHCKDEPPKASGASGEQMTLTSECRVAFATACP